MEGATDPLRSRSFCHLQGSDPCSLGGAQCQQVQGQWATPASRMKVEMEGQCLMAPWGLYMNVCMRVMYLVSQACFCTLSSDTFPG